MMAPHVETRLIPRQIAPSIGMHADWMKTISELLLMVSALCIDLETQWEHIQEWNGV